MGPKKTYRQQMRKVKGRMYGPYWYSEWREGGKVVTDYHGKIRPAEAGPEPAAPPPDLYQLDAGEGRTAECWLLLGYSAIGPRPEREDVRRRVWNLLKAKTRADGQKAEISAAWEHLCYTVWPSRSRRPQPP